MDNNETDKRYYLKKGDWVYATGVKLAWDEEKWHVVSFEDDTFYDGEYVQEVENNPYITQDT